MTRTPVTAPTTYGFVDRAGNKINGLALEPTTYLDQKSRYLNHLNEVCRMNMGDDTSDSPGYALNLIRFPISVLPGAKTMEGYGAEVTLTLTPSLSDDLLPTAFRNLVINDIIDEIAVPLTAKLNSEDGVEARNLTYAKAKIAAGTPVSKAASPNALRNMQDSFPKWSMGHKSVPSELKTDVEDKFKAKIKQRTDNLKNQNLPIRTAISPLNNTQYPLTPAQMLDVIDPQENLTPLLNDIFANDIANKYWIHYPDVQAYLKSQLSAAYEFLANPINCPIWQLCTPDLSVALKTHNKACIEGYRGAFFQATFASMTGIAEEDITIRLAWAIIVESALLNDPAHAGHGRIGSGQRLSVLCPNTGPFPYFLPNPPLEARHAFNDYVRCRWPIHVFSLDPESDQQVNISQTRFSRRRKKCN